MGQGEDFDHGAGHQGADVAPRGVARRTVVKGAAWSVPVVGAAVAAPAASASTSNADLAWTNDKTGLLDLRVLGDGGTLTADVAITVPTEFTLTNGSGAIKNEDATVTITVGRPSGLNVTLGKARGFGVYKYDGQTTSSGERSVNYSGAVGFPKTTWTATKTFSVDSSKKLQVPVEFGITGQHNSIIDINALAEFPVTLTIKFDDKTLTASTTISVPVGAGVL